MVALTPRARLGTFAKRGRDLLSVNQKAWETIANYESHELVRIRYGAKHNKRLNAIQSREIAACFTQARHYYSAATASDRAIKPLLIYYGILSLSRGIILFLTRGLREAALAQSHGLSVKDWQQALANSNIGDLRIVANKSGTFVELIKAIHNRNLLRFGSTEINSRSEHGSVPEGSEFALKQLLARLPEVRDQFSRWQTPLCVPFSCKQVDGSQEVIVTIRRDAPYVTEELVTEIFREHDSEIQAATPDQISIRTNEHHLYDVMTDCAFGDALEIGTPFLAQRYSADLNLAKAPQLFAISYLLGMLVRYHPRFWMDLVRQRISDAALPTIFRVIDCLETVFPQITADFLEE